MMANPNVHRRKLPRDPDSSLLTEVFRRPLIDCLALDQSLLANMVKYKLIRVDQHNKLSKHRTQHGIPSAAELLLKMISNAQQSNVVSIFIHVLRESDDSTNEQLADLIEGVNDIPEFDIEHGLIKEFYPQLQDIDPSEMSPYLTYIKPEDKDSMVRQCQMGESHLARSTLLLLTIRTRVDGWFDIFVDALQQTGHGNDARDLMLRRQNAEAVKKKPQSLSLSLESLSLEDNLVEENMATQWLPTGVGSLGESSSSLRERRSKRKVSFKNSDEPRRSRSESTKRHGSNTSQSQYKRQKMYNMLNRTRSESREGFQQNQQGGSVNQSMVFVQNITNNTFNNTVTMSHCSNTKAVVGGENNTVTFNDGQDDGHMPHMPKRAAFERPETRHGGEDQADHAAMPREDDIKVEDIVIDQETSFHEKTTSDEQRPKLFPDQLELAEDAIKGKNTVLVAPTGSGKTHVAAYIIHDHFIRNLKKAVKDRCALFLVTTVNLVEQQKNKLKELLRPSNFFSVIGLSGQSELSLQKEITSKNMIVLTAQLLENALTYIPLEHFSLLVFDECHLCQKDHAYNAIMARYLKEKQNGNDNLPQIIGMTASLGTGKAKDQGQANHHTIQICANMDAQSISMVTRNIEDLKSRVNIPKEVEPIQVFCRQQDPFADKIKEMMEKVEQKLTEAPSFEIRKHMNSEQIPGERESQAYRQWCDRKKRNAQKIISLDEDYRMLQTCISHLMDYNSALLINKQVRSKDAYNFLDKMIDKMKDRIGSFDNNDWELLKIFNNEMRTLETIKDDPDDENPLLDKLHEIILEEYRVRPTTRAILFVKTIDTTEALQDWIEETPDLKFLNPGRIAGSRDMNSNQQNKVIKGFRDGIHHMVVATNLLEQGTDVPACNLVIRLDYVPSDFGHVQIKGRTRAKDGKSYLITLIDSNAADRDEANRQREVMMTKAADNLKSKPDTEFLQLMRQQQARDEHDRDTKQQQKKDILQSNEGKLFQFRCSMCGQLAFKSDDIEVFKESLFVVLDNDFQHQMRMKLHPKPKKLGQDRTIIGKIFCKKCEHDWGSLARVKNSYYPSIRIAQFSLVNDETHHALTYKKWKKAPFKPKILYDLPPTAAVKVPTELLKMLKKL